MITVLISGSGKMGSEIAAALDAANGISPAGFVDSLAEPGERTLPSGGPIPVYAGAEEALDATKPDVVIDFTNAAWTPVIAAAAVARGVRPVIGTSGLSDAYINELAALCRERRVGGLVAANFAIGAVLMMHMAAIASRFFDSAEIIELHHDQKVDAPSGTAIATAQAMLAARGGRAFARNDPSQQTVAGSRAAAIDGVTVHSVRLPGLVAHQEVLFGGAGQTLSLRHDTIGRESFMPGIVLATREVMRREELVIGLGALVGLE